MIDLKKYQNNIQHDPSRAGVTEMSNMLAIQVDGSNGLAQDLGFHSSGLSKVDYFIFKSNEVFLIELTSLKDDIQECIDCDHLLKRSSEVRKYIKEYDRNGLKKVQKKLWMEVIEEFKGKWMGSIALHERLLRRNQIIDDPDYRLIIVLKNDTDEKIRDLLQTMLRNKLSGMISKIDVFLTKEL